MGRRVQKILVVEPDAEILEILVASLSKRFDAHITCVSDAVSCLDVEMVEPHDLVIAECDLPGEHGIKLAEQLMALSSRPVILLTDEIECDQVVEALRIRVYDIFRKPFPVEDLLDVTENALNSFVMKRRRAVRYRKMRDMVRKVIRERRGLNERIELVCRDLVGAQKRLLTKVASIDK